MYLMCVLPRNLECRNSDTMYFSREGNYHLEGVIQVKEDWQARMALMTVNSVCVIIYADPPLELSL